jgi:hypothetical protein
MPLMNAKGKMTACLLKLQGRMEHTKKKNKGKKQRVLLASIMVTKLVSTDYEKDKSLC